MIIRSTITNFGISCRVEFDIHIFSQIQEGWAELLSDEPATVWAQWLIVHIDVDVDRVGLSNRYSFLIQPKLIALTPQRQIFFSLPVQMEIHKRFQWLQRWLLKSKSSLWSEQMLIFSPTKNPVVLSISIIQQLSFFISLFIFTLNWKFYLHTWHLIIFRYLAWPDVIMFIQPSNVKHDSPSKLAS